VLCCAVPCHQTHTGWDRVGWDRIGQGRAEKDRAR
jgi:hypothetical protein